MEGILIAADRNIEDLIPWWWNSYARYDNRPVAIVDFGLSKEVLQWCQDRMQILSFSYDDSFICPKEKISQGNIKRWTKGYRGPLWKARQAWFKKPQACLLSPFNLTLWMDIDCEVCGPLDALFAEWEEPLELAIAKQDIRFSRRLAYNSGVFLFRQESPFLHRWNSLCRKQNKNMLGDQDILTCMLVKNQVQFKELSPFYNWLMYRGIHPGIVIAHWAAGWGKEYIRRFGGLQTLLKSSAAG